MKKLQKKVDIVNTDSYDLDGITVRVKRSIGRYVDRLFRRNKFLTLYNSDIVFTIK